MIAAAAIAEQTPAEFIPENGTHKSVYNVIDFGAAGDGKADDTTAFQKAIAAAGENELGGIVSVPVGNFLIKTHLEILPNVMLKGIWEIPTARTQMKGSTLLAVEGAGQPNGAPFIMLKQNSTVKGLTIFYPNQTPTNPPVEYPWTIAAGGADNCSIIDVLIVNPYQAVDFGTRTSGRHYIRNLYGQPLRRGIYVDQCYDVGRIENVHFWPFWGEHKETMEYIKEHGEAFILAKTDWEYLSNCFSIFYNIGFHFIGTSFGPGNALLTQSGADVCPNAVVVADCQSHAGISFVNSQLYGRIKVMDSNTGPVRFTACGLFGASVSGADEAGIADIAGNGHVSFDNCHFISLDPKNLSKTNIRINGGGLTISDSLFMDIDRNYIELSSGVKTAIINANTFGRKDRIINKSDGEVVISGNVFNVVKEDEGAIIIDNSDGEPGFSFIGEWMPGKGGGDYMGNVRWSIKGKGEAKAFWRPEIKKSGLYSVYVWHGGDPFNNHAKNAAFKISHGQNEDVKIIDQTKDTGKWIYLGDYEFRRAEAVCISVSNDADGNVVADAIKLMRKKSGFMDKVGGLF